MKRLLKNTSKLLYLPLILVVLISCQGAVEPTDQGRFGEEPTPTPATITFDAISNISGAEGAFAFTPSLSCSSSDGTDPDYFSVVDDNDNVDCTISTGNIVLCTLGTFTGHNNVSVDVNAYCNYPDDGETQNFTLTVIAVNNAPELTGTTNQAVYVNNAISSIDFNDNGNDQDVDEDPITYACSFSGGAFGAGTNCSSLPGTVNFSTSAGTLSWTPNLAAANGTSSVVYSIVVIGSDDQAPTLSDTESFTITVNAVTPPVYSSSNPLSPTNVTTTPLIIGTSSSDTQTINLYSSAGCTSGTLLGTGTKASWEGTGINASVTANTTTPIYAMAVDGSGNVSPCTFMTNYTHDNIGPTDPTFVSTSPTSPSNASTTPAILGGSSADTTNIDIYSDSGCSTQIGTGNKATFESIGITATAAANNTTAIYARARDSLSNNSNCVLLTNYTHDNIAPSAPSFSSTSPASPSTSVTSPNVIGGASADTQTIYLYNENTCATQIGTGTRATFIGSGIIASVTPNASTTIYGTSQDSASNTSACTLLTTYTHDNTGPADPTFSSTNPVSPSASDTTPNVIGASSGDTATVTLYSDNLCATSIGSGTKANFEGAGIVATATANAATTIYARAFDTNSNGSNCVLLTSYTHDNTGPADPSFVSTTPSSPNNSSTSPSVLGTASADTATLNLYSENTCSSSIGSGTKANFESGGISATVTANATTTIYAQALDALANASSCVLLTSYTHDNIAPAGPSFSSSSPVSPSASDTTPEIIGSSSGDTLTLNLYSDASCSTQIGTGTKAVFEGVGITATVSANATTSIYADALDSVGNKSNCTLMLNYTHDSTGPADPSFASTNPSSPSNSDLTPNIIGSSSADTTNVFLFSDSGCSSALNSGTKATFEGAGIGITVTANTQTTIYARAQDALSNNSNCTLLTTYTHDNVDPAVASFSSTSPASPSTSVTTPFVIGGAASDVVTVSLYNENTCSSQIGTGTRSTFIGSGIQASVTPNNTTPIYGTTTDAAANTSTCTLLTNYIHDNTGPTDPSFSSTSPASPSASDTAPEVIGSSSGDTTTVSLYSDSGCTTSIGSGTKATFEGAGITATVTANTATTIYARASDTYGNTSNCTLLTSYTHDNTAPTAPSFTSTTPSSPNNSSTTPSVIGSASADTTTINLFLENTCATGIGSGTKANFESAGISATASANATTTIYAQALDSLSNTSACTLLVSYTHDNVGPADPSFSSTNPASPSATDTAPEVIGSSSVDTVTINLHTNASCSNQIGTGTKASFEAAGITASVSANSDTSIYAQAFDSLGNESNCTLLTSYTHDNTGPSAPSFSSITPASPNNSSTTPDLVGASSGDTISVEAFSDSSCTVSIGTGTKALFEGAGISLSVTANTTSTIYLRAQDALGNTSACTFMTNYTHDTVAPTDVTAVNDGVNSTSVTASPALSWSGASDATSGIARYEVSLGTSAGDTSTLNWTDVGVTTTTTITSIAPNLNSGTTYYANVRVVDNAGNTSSVVSGDGWLVDATPPTTVTVTADGCTTKTIKGSWTSSTDAESSIDHYEYSLGTSAGATDEISWTSTALATSINLSGQTLTEAQTYYLNVKAINSLGLESSVTNASVSCTDLNTSLQGFWKLGEAAGLRVDEQGSNNLTPNGLVSQQAGVAGNATGFSSTTFDYLSSIDGGELTVSDQDFSISVWVYVANNLTSQPIITKWNGATDEYYLDYIGSTGFRFRVDSATVSFPISVANDTWYHVIATHNSSTDTINLYVNNSAPASQAFSGGPTGGNSVFEVGAQSGDVTYFTGRIDALGFWKKVLTTYEREVLYNTGSGLEPAF